MLGLYSQLNAANVKSSVLTITPPFCDNFVSKRDTPVNTEWVASDLRLENPEAFSREDIDKKNVNSFVKATGLKYEMKI